MSPQPLFVAATTSYLVNCALGASVAAGLVDTRRIRWVHHALYISTCVLAAAAAGTGILSRPTARADTNPARTAALALLPAAAPLAAIPYVSTRSSKHMRVALSAAPFFVASLIISRRG
ncbi:hypothetical protein [Herbiconiux solani]|uniref:hypothetical protein n=1 Tax=Herbiconiux solani TaxID=661329 RepID=UPI000824BFC0|nr:hypothetical protein [Herbiconiux solani]